MKLSIIIPCDNNILQTYDLTHMFNSLNNQVHNDWKETEIILVHPYHKYKFDMSQYNELKPYFKAYYCKHSTYSEIKQFGLDIAQGDYILFLMPNTILYSMTSLIDIIQLLNDNNMQDYILYSVGDCVNIDSNTHAITQVNSLTSLDGKLFKRDFLINNNINFPENITSGEDLYFTQKVLNFNPQYMIENSFLILKIYNDIIPVSLEEQYLNNVQVLSSINTENVINTTNTALNKIVQMLLQIYESLYSYNNVEYRNLIKANIKNFVLSLQHFVNINAIFGKCMEVSNNYSNNEIIELNNNMTFYDFIVSIFVDEQQEQIEESNDIIVNEEVKE